MAKIVFRAKIIFLAPAKNYYEIFRNNH